MKVIAVVLLIGAALFSPFSRTYAQQENSPESLSGTYQWGNQLFNIQIKGNSFKVSWWYADAGQWLLPYEGVLEGTHIKGVARVMSKDPPCGSEFPMTGTIDPVHGLIKLEFQNYDIGAWVSQRRCVIINDSKEFSTRFRR